MIRRAKLDEPRTREKVLAALRGGCRTLGEAAKAAKINRKTLTRYVSANPGFAKEVEAARITGARPAAMAPVLALARTVRDEVEQGEVVDPEVVGLKSSRTDKDRALAAALMIDEDLIPAGDPGGVSDFFDDIREIFRDPEANPGLRAVAAKMLEGALIKPLQDAQKDRNARLANATEVGDDTETVILSIPANGSEAPGHEPQPAEAWDAEGG